MKRVLASLSATGLFLTACGGVTEDDHYESADELVEAYESEGGECNEPQTQTSFDDHGDAVRCSSGVSIYTWADPPRREADVPEELQEVLRLHAGEERRHVAHQTWAFSVKGEDSAEWVHERFGGRILSVDAYRDYVSPLHNAYEECNDPEWDEGLTYDETYEVMTVNGAYQKLGDHLSAAGTAAGIAWICVEDELSVPRHVQDHIGSTTSLQGRQDARWDEFSASWSYHPNNGLNLTLEWEGDS